MNSKTGFLTIARKDCHDTACEIVKNAETHLSIAEDLEKSNHYGFAMSHYITALEELTKALVLNLDGAGFRFRSVKEFGALFSNHEFRYFLSFFIFFMSIFDDDLTQLCTYLNTNQVKLEKILKDVSIDKKDQIIKWVGSFLGTIFMSGYLNSKIETVKKETEWFKQMKLTREECIYTGYTNKVQSPLDFTEGQYIAYLARICKVINIIKILNSHVLNESKFIFDLKKGVNNSSFYASLNEELKKIRSNKGSNFESFSAGYEQFVELFSEKSRLVFLELFLSEILPFILTNSIKKPEIKEIV